MKNTTGSLTFDGLGGQGWSRGSKQYDHNQSRLTPKTTGDRANLKGNMACLGKPVPQGDQASNDSGPIVGSTRPMNWRNGGAKDTHVDTLTRGRAGPRRGNPSTAGGV
jgi:hypothetical protein